MPLELLASAVDAMEKSKSEWEGLCREMLATITMDGNKDVFAVLPETWHSIVSSWVNKFHEIEAAEQRVQRSACCRAEIIPGIREGEPDLCSVCGGKVSR